MAFGYELRFIRLTNPGVEILSKILTQSCVKIENNNLGFASPLTILSSNMS